MLRSLSPSRSRNDREGQEPEGSSPLRRLSSSGSRRRRSFRRDRRPAPAELKDAEDPEKFEREWGVSKQKEEELLQKFKSMLKEEGILNSIVDKYTLRRFLRARQHDLKRARDMFAEDVKWRKQFGTDTILDDFHFHERDAFISVYPQGYHKTDKLGRPVYIQHIGQINVKRIYELTTEERATRFHVQEYERCARCIMPACSRAAGHHIDQTFAIIDAKGVGLKHLTGDVKKMMSKILAIDQNHYPEMLGHTVIINAPSVFKLVFAAVKPMLDVRTQDKIEVAGGNYLPQLLHWVDKDNLPDYLGGTSTATLIDDAGPWQDAAIMAEVEALRAQSGLIDEEPDAEAGAEADGSSPGHPSADKDALRQQEGASSLADRDERFSEAPSALRRLSSSATSVGEDGYYSPREDSVTGSEWGDAMSERAGSLADLAAVSPAGGSPVSASQHQVPLKVRVQALEAGVPQHQERLAAFLEGKGGVLGGDQAPLLGRVENLERAMAQLLKAQEAADQTSSKAAVQKDEKQGTGCCGCTIM
ncbi:hypothetical protein WJX73_008330 [Symbiochloris irregularis]|uniref:CRAL-TRIO domain-containing protein n=1 Tax=Symbiochloris irregularis TaxID=706552 RepID=A0AAW1NXS8_9CHLO